MITIRKSADRGRTNIDWLDSRHSFSFGEYYDPRNAGFRNLRVINDDFIGAGGGFGMHPHRDMEIVSYVVRGALQHRDSMGNGSTIGAGEVQYMGAGTGVSHSEFNPSKTEDMRLLQIWLIPEARGLAPAYAQRPASNGTGHGLTLLASRDGRDGSIAYRTDADLWGAKFAAGESAAVEIKPGRHAWVQVVSGTLSVNGSELKEGDAAQVSEETKLALSSVGGAEALVFDLG